MRSITTRAIALLAVTCLGLSIWAAGAGAGAAKKAPNLKVTELSEPPSGAHAGDQIDISDKIKNAGNKMAPASVVRFYLEPEEKRGNPFRLIGDQNIHKLGSKATANANGSFGIPHDTPDGDYRIVACADDKKQVHESSEKDNCRTSKSAMTVQGF